jgi:hypothetical protein
MNVSITESLLPGIPESIYFQETYYVLQGPVILGAASISLILPSYF